MTNRTIVEDRHNVLEQNIIEGSHRMIMNVTSWPLLFDTRCTASQYFPLSPVTTQNGPSRSRASSLKPWRRGVSVVVVMLSYSTSRPWWSTKIKLSREVFIVNSLKYKKKLYLADNTSTHLPPSWCCCSQRENRPTSNGARRALHKYRTLRVAAI